MSNYERNNNMVVCIIAVLVVGTVATAAISYFGGSRWSGFDNTPVDFYFDRNTTAVSGLVTLDVDIDAGSLNILFEDNASLLYRIDFRTNNQTIIQYGNPAVSFTSNRITFDYESGSGNITLGTAVNYTLDVDVAAGDIGCVLSDGARVEDVSLAATTGTVTFAMTSDVVIIDSPTFRLDSETGSINVNAALPTDVGGDFEGAASLGSVTITAPGWTEITANHYRTDDFTTAQQSVQFVAQAGTGSVTAILS